MNTQEASLSFRKDTQDIIRLNNWIFDNIQPYIKGRTLELGSGSGLISSLFIVRDLPVHLSDENSANREGLLKKFDGLSAMRMVHDIDFNDRHFEQTYVHRAGVFSTIIAINIAEHGVYNRSMLHKAAYFLRIRGHFIAITPSNAVLFNAATGFKDLKKYNLKIARDLMGESFEILKVRYFDWSAGSDSSSMGQSGLYTLAIFRKKNDVRFTIQSK